MENATNETKKLEEIILLQLIQRQKKVSWVKSLRMLHHSLKPAEHNFMKKKNPLHFI